MTPLVKICGVTTVADAELAATAGADLIGCVLAPDSPRHVEATRAREIAAAVAVPVVLVFRDASCDDILAACSAAGVQRVQLHGSRPPNLATLERHGISVRIAVAAEDADFERLPAATEARPLVLDVGRGGTGRTFDWSLLGDVAPPHTFVAGGITPENVGALLARAPHGIDLSTGVERAPGVKDGARLRALFAAIGAGR